MYDATICSICIVRLSGGSDSSSAMVVSLAINLSPSYLAPIAVSFAATFVSSTYLWCIFIRKSISSSLLFSSRSHHTINTWATTPVSSKPIGPPSFCFFRMPAKSYVCVLSIVSNTILSASVTNFLIAAVLISDMSGNTQGLYLSSSFSAIPHPVMLGLGPRLFLLFGQYSCIPMACNSASVLFRLRYSDSSL